MVALVVGLGITITTGIVCGRVSQRWGPVPDLVAAGKHLSSLPTQIGSWQLLEEDSMSESEIQMLSCAGYVNRKYIDRRSGDTVSMAIYVGPSGPISVHTPEVCFSSRDYTPEAAHRRVEFAAPNNLKHSLWSTTFRANNAIADRLRVYYGWLVDDTWTAAESPRFTFAGSPMLFKLQIACSVPPGKSGDGIDPCHAFLQELFRSGWKVRN